MRYPEFEKLTLMVDLRNRLAPCYGFDDGVRFYLEPGFYQALQSIRAIYPDRYQDAIAAVETLARRNRVTIFAADDENPLVSLDENFVVYSPTDIIDFLGLAIEDKSRGSDYGD